MKRKYSDQNQQSSSSWSRQQQRRPSPYDRQLLKDEVPNLASHVHLRQDMEKRKAQDQFQKEQLESSQRTSSTDPEHLPTEGTFAASHSISSTTNAGLFKSAGVADKGLQNQLRASRIPPTAATGFSGKVEQSRQSSIHNMTLPQSCSMASQILNAKNHNKNNQQIGKNGGQSSSFTYMPLSAKYPNYQTVKATHNQESQRQQLSLVQQSQQQNPSFISKQSTPKELTTQSSAASGGQGNKIWFPTGPQMNLSQGGGVLSHLNQSNRALGMADLGSIPAEDSEKEQTINLREQREKEKWIDMPLSTENNSSRTTRSYLVVSKQGGGVSLGRNRDRAGPEQYISTITSEQQTLDMPSNAGGVLERQFKTAVDSIQMQQQQLHQQSHGHRMSPQFASITDIPAALVTGDQRSTTPFLGGMHHEDATMAAHNQVPIQSASSATRESDGAESQRQTQRSCAIGYPDQSPGKQQQEFNTYSRTNNTKIQKSGSQVANQRHQRSKEDFAANQQQLQLQQRPVSLYVLPSAERQDNGTNAAFRAEQTRSTQDFRRKLGNLQDALSTIKTNLSSIKQASSAKQLIDQRPSQNPKFAKAIRSNRGGGVSNPYTTMSDSSNQNLQQQNHTKTSRISDVRSKSHPQLNQSRTMESNSQYKRSNRGNSNNSKNSEMLSRYSKSSNSNGAATRQQNPLKPLLNHQSYRNQPTNLLQSRKAYNQVGHSSRRQLSRTFDCREATGKFVNPNKTASGRGEKENITSYTMQIDNSHKDSKDNIVMKKGNSRGLITIETEQSQGESIEQVHMRHQSSLQLEEYQKRRKLHQSSQQTLKNQAKDKAYQMTTASLRHFAAATTIQPLNLSKLDQDSKSVPQIMKMSVKDHSRDSKADKNEQKSSSSLHYSQEGTGGKAAFSRVAAATMMTNCNEDERQQQNQFQQDKAVSGMNRSHSSPVKDGSRVGKTIAYYTQRQAARPTFINSHYKKVFQERRGTEGSPGKKMNQPRYQTHTLDQITQLNPQTIESSNVFSPPTIQSPSAPLHQEDQRHVDKLEHEDPLIQILEQQQPFSYHEQHQQARDEPKPNVKFVRSISSPVIVPAQASQYTYTNEDTNSNERVGPNATQYGGNRRPSQDPLTELSLLLDYEEKRQYECQTRPKVQNNQRQSRDSRDQTDTPLKRRQQEYDGNKSQQLMMQLYENYPHEQYHQTSDETSEQHQSKEDAILKKVLQHQQPQPQSEYFREQRDQRIDETHAQMQSLKAQLESLQSLQIQQQQMNSQQQPQQPPQPATNVECQQLQKRLEESEKDRLNLKKELFQLERDKIGLEASVKLTAKENKIIKRKNQNQDESIKRKEAVIAELEMQAEQMRDKAQARQGAIEEENQRLQQDLNRIQEQLQQKELDEIELRNIMTRQQSLANSERLFFFDDERIETRFLTDLLKTIGADQEQANFEKLIKKLKKQQKFCQKISKMVTDVEGHKVDSLKECLKWIKGLLKDFIALRSQIQEQQQQDQTKGFTSQKYTDDSNCLSPIQRHGQFSLAVESNGLQVPRQHLTSDIAQNGGNRAQHRDSHYISNSFSPRGNRSNYNQTMVAGAGENHSNYSSQLLMTQYPQSANASQLCIGGAGTLNNTIVQQQRQMAPASQQQSQMGQHNMMAQQQQVLSVETGVSQRKTKTARRVTSKRRKSGRSAAACTAETTIAAGQIVNSNAGGHRRQQKKKMQRAMLMMTEGNQMLSTSQPTDLTIITNPAAGNHQNQYMTASAAILSRPIVDGENTVVFNGSMTDDHQHPIGLVHSAERQQNQVDKSTMYGAEVGQLQQIVQHHGNKRTHQTRNRNYQAHLQQTLPQPQMSPQPSEEQLMMTRSVQNLQQVMSQCPGGNETLNEGLHMSTFSHPTQTLQNSLCGHRGSQQVLSFGRTGNVTPYMDLIDDFADDNGDPPSQAFNSHKASCYGQGGPNQSSSLYVTATPQQTLPQKRGSMMQQPIASQSRSRVMSQDDLHQQSRQSFNNQPQFSGSNHQPKGTIYETIQPSSYETIQSQYQPPLSVNTNGTCQITNSQFKQQMNNTVSQNPLPPQSHSTLTAKQQKAAMMSSTMLSNRLTIDFPNNPMILQGAGGSKHQPLSMQLYQRKSSHQPISH